MKKGVYIAALCLAFVLVSGDVNAKNTTMDDVLNAYKNGDFKTAEKLAKSLPKTYTDPSVKKLGKKAKTAYKKLLKKQNANEYYFIDLDQDGSPEMAYTAGSCEANMKLNVVSYNKKIVNRGSVSCGEMYFAADPTSHRIVYEYGHMGYEMVGTMALKNGKIKATKLNTRENTNDYLELPYVLNNHLNKAYELTYKMN
jgi:hypothetical protein